MLLTSNQIIKNNQSPTNITSDWRSRTPFSLSEYNLKFTDQILFWWVDESLSCNTELKQRPFRATSGNRKFLNALLWSSFRQNYRLKYFRPKRPAVQTWYCQNALKGKTEKLPIVIRDSKKALLITFKAPRGGKCRLRFGWLPRDLEVNSFHWSNWHTKHRITISRIAAVISSPPIEQTFPKHGDLGVTCDSREIRGMHITECIKFVIYFGE